MAPYSYASSEEAARKMKECAKKVFEMKYEKKNCNLTNLQLISPLTITYDQFNQKKAIVKTSTLSNSEVPMISKS